MPFPPDNYHSNLLNIIPSATNSSPINSLLNFQSYWRIRCDARRPFVCSFKQLHPYSISSTLRQLGESLPRIRCDGMACCTAVALREKSAALVLFQRHQPSDPPCKIVDSAGHSRIPASHFGGNCAKSAKLSHFVH